MRKSGDGIVGFLAGAAFRIGAEGREEFGEKFAPDESYGELLGHSIYFYSKDAGRPVQYVPPSYALQDITAVPRWRDFKADEHGCRLWWIEYGGRLDTVHETETIKWELWKVVYGVWNHIKNSGRFPEAANLTLEWVGTIPGKRESRRFEGDYMLTQRDVVEQRRHADAVSFGGWAIDLHPADGVYSPQSGCTQWHSKGVYQIPYRTMFSRNITNLFLAGRIISASHVAFGSTRVMATCAHNAQAVGMAAAMCARSNLLPRDLLEPQRMRRLQSALLRTGHYIPHVRGEDENDLARSATLTVSSELALDRLRPCGTFAELDHARAILLPVQAGPVPKVTFFAKAAAACDLAVELRGCTREDGFTPDETLESKTVALRPSAAADADPVPITVAFESVVRTPRYLMVCLRSAAGVEVAVSDDRVTGVESVAHRANTAVSKAAVQTPPPDVGVDSFEFWRPQRRPSGRNLALRLDPPIRAFAARNVLTDPQRPTHSANAWVAAFDDATPWIELRWPAPREVRGVTLFFDTDFDHALESVLMGHPERVVPFVVRDFSVVGDGGNVLAAVTGNYRTRRALQFDLVRTSSLRIELARPSANVPASLFRVAVHECRSPGQCP